MLRLLKNNIFIIFGIFIISFLLLLSGLLLTRSYEKEIISQVSKEQYNKLDKFEKVLVSYNSFNRNKLLSVERIILNLFQGKKIIEEHISDTLLVEANNSNDSIIGLHSVSKLVYEEKSLLFNSELLEEITYNTNAFINIWQKTYGGYVLIASNEPGIPQDDITLFLDKSNELVKEIEKGNKYLSTKYTEFDSKTTRSIPIYIRGDVKAFIQIIIIETLTSTYNKIFSEDQSDFFVIDSKGYPIVSSHLLKTDFTEADLLSNLTARRGRFKSIKTDSYTIYYSYVSDLQMFAGFVISDNIIKERYRIYATQIWMSLLFSAVGLIIFVLLYDRKIKKSNTNITSIFSELISGSKDNNINEQVKLIPKKLKEYLDDILNFTSNLAVEKINNKFNVLNENDEIAVELLKLQEKIKITFDTNIERIKEEKLRVNLSKGSDKITELLQYVSDMNELAFNIIKNTAQFIDIQQGGMFILDESVPDKPVLEMIASFAYDKQRFANKKIPVNEGLIGRAYLERESIYMTEIPKNYTLIESGFGELEPKSLLIVPLIFNNKVQAVIELASKDIIEDYKIKYIEDIGENIASTISNLKHSKQTQELLEQTRVQSLEIEDQRKTLEEKINTHRRQNRKLDKEILQLIEIIESIKSITFMIEYDLKGVVMDVSGKTLNLLEAKKEEFITVHHKDVILNENYDKTYETFWSDLSENKTQTMEEVIFFKGKEYKLSQSYVPIRNAKRKIYRILSIGTLLS